MFDHYSERARRVVFLARVAAGKRGATYVDTEDLLVALIREDQRQFLMATRAMSPGRGSPPPEQAHLPEPFFSEDMAESLLQASEGPPQGPPVPQGTDMPISEAMKKALKLAAEIADRHQHKMVQPVHLLAAVVEDREDPLAKLLADHGINRRKVKEALDQSGV
jgi:ATP-dependent Clp protease ATP-binding subunit ClpC